MPMQKLEFPEPPHINAIRGATPADAERTRKMLDLCFDLFVSAIQNHIDNLRENTPFIFDNFKYELAQLADARKSILDGIEAVGERLEDQS